MTAPRRPPADAATRKRIVDDVERSCLVEASAGTGKTSLLVQRILTLFRHGAPAEGIVAITFTEKAAAELLGRLRDDLQTATATADDAGRDRLRTALDELDRATVTTIHSFCSRLLREYPVAAGLSPGFTVLDAVASRALFDETWESWLGRQLDRVDGGLRVPLAWGARLSGGMNATGLKDMARALHGHRDLLPHFRASAGDPRARRAEKLRALQDGAHSRLRDIRARLGSCRAPGEDRAFRELTAAAADLSARLERLHSDPESEAPLVLPTLNWPRIGKFGRAADWDPGTLKETRAASAEFVEFLPAAVMEVAATVAVEAVLALDGFLGELEAAKARAGSVDFDDLLLRARDLLRGSRAVRAELRHAITHLLIDEFQDTDPVQAEIIFLLAADDPATSDWRLSRPAPGRLFLVGDPKQSIYRFRRADITLYDECRTILAAAGGAAETIEVNFRTLGSILSWVNGLFTPLMVRGDDPLEAAFRPEYSPLTPHRAAAREPGLPAVARLPLEPAGTTAVARRADEAARIAALARRLVDGGEGCVCDRESGHWRPPHWGDIALLFRAYSALPIYEEALRDAGIPYRVDGGRLYYARGEVQSLLAVLRAVDNPNDRLALVAALRSPFFAFRDETLFLAHAESALSWAGPGPGDPELAGALAQLLGWHRQRHALGPARLVEEILAGCRALEFYALKPDGEQRVANLRKIADEARRFSRDVGAVRAFLTHLTEREAAFGSEAEGESPIEEDGDRSHLHLLSIHKSKGLEFPIVVLADPGHAGGGGTPRVLVDRVGRRLALSLSLAARMTARTPEWDALARLDRAQERAEEIRLFYVACTRARDQLIVPAPPAGGTREGFIALLDDHEPEGGESIPVAIDAASAGAPVFRLDVPFDVPAVGDPLASATLRFHERQEALRAGRPRGPVRLSPSALGHLAPGAARGTAPHIAEGRGDAGGQGLGAIVHDLLEAGATAGPLLEARLTRHLRDSGEMEGDAKLVRSLLEAAAASPVAARLRGALDIRREAPFLSRHPLPDGSCVLLDGRVDLAFLEPDGWVIVDYKTDRVPPGGVDPLFDRYRGQALGYALGVGRSLVPQGADRVNAGHEQARFRVKEVVFVFLRTGEERSLQVTPERLAEARGLLERAVVPGR